MRRAFWPAASQADSHSRLRSRATRIWSFLAWAVVTKGWGSMATAPAPSARAATHSACSLFHSMVTSESGSRPAWRSTYSSAYWGVAPLPAE